MAVTEIGTQFVCIVLSGAILFIFFVERAEPRAQFVGQRSGTPWPTNRDQALESTAIVSSLFEIMAKTLSFLALYVQLGGARFGFRLG